MLKTGIKKCLSTFNNLIVCSGILSVGRNTLPVCRNQCCLLGGSQEHLLSEDCQTSLDADVSCSQLSLLLLLHHLPALLYLFFGKLTSDLALPCLLAIVFTDTFEHKPIYPI